MIPMRWLFREVAEAGSQFAADIISFSNNSLQLSEV